MKEILGIDVGGTGIKGGIVNLKTGELITERIKIKTAKPASPDSIGQQVKELIKLLEWNKGDIGIGFPSVIKNGKTLTAANVHKDWVNFDIVGHFSAILGQKIFVINDADAAGLAECTYTEHLKSPGLNLFLTLGTGIGSAMFHNGELIPNSELGHLFYKKLVAEKYVSNSAREIKKLSWSAWGKELNLFLKHIELVLRPNEIILGGGVSKKFDNYSKYLTIETPVKSAALLNQAGVIGAGLAASKKMTF